MTRFAPLLSPTCTTQFLDANRTNLRSSSSRRHYQNTLRRLQEAYPGKPVTRFTQDDLAGWLSALPHSSATIANRRSILCSFFGWALFAGVVNKDPSVNLKRLIRVSSKPSRTHTWLDEDGFRQFFKACRNDPNPLVAGRDSVIAGLGLFMALRVHEIAGVSWEDLRGNQLVLVGKGTKPATLPLPADMVGILDDWRSISNPICSAVLPRFHWEQDHGWAGQVLVADWGSRLGVAGVYGVVKKRGAQIGHPELAPHDLRRSCAGLLEARGVQLRDIKALLRHDSVATTEKYLSGNPSRWGERVGGAMEGLML